ncbi:hypothetical protein HYU14_03700 [Candidatus Woesearchaeota archaeon]|nr:hypothetical protein [Candidatus Woesearchaeota archaeon]
MQRWADFQYKIKQYFGLAKTEIIGIAVSIIILSFIISFRQWGKGDFSLAAGLLNWFNAGLITGLVVVISHAVQRLVGLYHGYRVEYKMWTLGLLAGLFAAFVSYGRVWLLLPGGIVMHHLAGHRLGYHRYGPDHYMWGIISLTGTFAAIFTAFAFKLVSLIIENPLIDRLIFFAVIYALYDLLPFPASTGLKLFYASRLVYIFNAVMVVVLGLLLLTPLHPAITVAISIFVAIVSWLLYYLHFERYLWKGPYAGGWVSKVEAKK